jgi:hypothetical protein
MSFHVEPPKLETFQQLLSPGLAGQTATAKQYLDDHLNLTMWEKGLIGQGIWAQAISRMGDAKNAINADLDKLNTLSAGSAGELGKSAAMYRHTDTTTAEKLDNTYG